MPRKPNYDRDDLIARARDLFWKQGWAGTSLKDLEAVLAMKPGSFYAAFGSKEALYALALEKYAEESREGLDALAQRYGPRGALERLPGVIAKADAAPAKACMLSKTLLEIGPQDHPLAQLANQHLAAMESHMAGLFESAQHDGTIDQTADPQRLARRYQSDLLGLRVISERADIDAAAIAAEMAEGVRALAG